MLGLIHMFPPALGLAPTLALCLTLSLALTGGPALAHAPTAPTDPIRQFELSLRELEQPGRILYVVAHPDDEDSGLLARLCRGEGHELLLLTLTRGEGGQNEVGTELFDALGVLRSRELEASSNYIGNLQRFSRAFEFGYSFSVEETYDLWGYEPIVREIVATIRDFQPDVVLTMWPGGPGGGQHHQASARMTYDAFEIAGTDRWPELGTPHRASRLFQQVRRDIDNDHAPERLVALETGQYDAVLGSTYQEFGLRGRESHQCQGMARLREVMPTSTSRWYWAREWSGSTVREPSPATALDHFFSGLDLTWTDDPKSEAKVARLLEESRRSEGADKLRRVREAFEELKSTSFASASREETWRRRFQRLVALSAQVAIEVRADRRLAAAGDELDISIGLFSSEEAELKLEIVGPTTSIEGSPWSGPAIQAELDGENTWKDTVSIQLPQSMEPSIARPVPRGPAVGDVDPREFAAPTWGAFYAKPTLTLDGMTFDLEPVRIVNQELDAELPQTFYSDLHVVPDPSIRTKNPRVPLPLFDGPGAGAAETEITWWVSSLKGGEIEVVPSVPPGWTIEPASRTVSPRPGAEVPAKFTLRPPASLRDDANPTGPEVIIAARARHLESGEESRVGYQRVEHRHIRPGALLVSSEFTITPFRVEMTSGLRVGFVEGSGDQMPAALNVLGIEAVPMSDADLLEGDLDRFDVIVTGVRAYKVREDLAAAQPRLMEWVERGGTLLVQYNKFEFNAGEQVSSPFAPFPETKVGRRRVTDPASPVVVNHADHPVFAQPNRIVPGDWEGWVQERGLYFLDVTDPRYLDLITLEDPWPLNAGPKGGALVDAPVGEGHWVYVGVGLFRQLPAAVPGAYRLLANLLAL